MALRHFTKAMEILEENGLHEYGSMPDIIMSIGLCRYRSGDIETALDDFCKAIVILKDDTSSRPVRVCTAYEMAGICSYEIGGYDAAGKYYREAMEKGKFELPKYFGRPGDVLLYTALTYCILGRYDKASEILTGDILQAIEEMPDGDPKMYLFLLLSFLQFVQDNEKASTECYFKAVMSGGNSEKVFGFARIIDVYKSMLSCDDQYGRHQRMQTLVMYIEHPNDEW